MRQALAEKTGLSGDSILTWVNHADLFRINGVAGEFSELLEASGVNSVPELAQRVAANLHGRMTEVNAQKSLTRRVPAQRCSKTGSRRPRPCPAWLSTERR